MSNTDNAGSGEGGEQPEREPRIGLTFEYEDFSSIEDALNTPGEHFLGEANAPLSRPLQTANVKLIVLEPEEDYAPTHYAYTAEFALRDNFAQKNKAGGTFTQSLEEEFAAIPDYNGDNSEPLYIFMSEGAFCYGMWRDSNAGKIFLTSLGGYRDRPPAPGDTLHRVNDPFEVALDDFLETAETVTGLLYKAYSRQQGYYTVRVGLSNAEEVTTQEVTPPVLPAADTLEAASEERVPYPSFEHVAGMEAVKQELLSTALSFQNPEILKAWGVEQAPTGIVLYGPGGTGKTTLARALANEIDATLVEVRSNDIYGRYMGDSEGNFAALLDRVEASEEPVVLLFDEIDGIIFNRGSASYEAVHALFKQRVSDLQRKNPNVIVVATTNNLDKVDPTIIRDGRFDKKIYVPVPDEETRKAIFGQLITDVCVAGASREVYEFENIDYAELARLTDEWTGAEIDRLLRGLQANKALEEIQLEVVPSAITHAEIVKAIAQQRQQRL